MTHALKTWPKYFKAVTSGLKPFEVRKNDRTFNSGDKILLQEFDPEKSEYTGEEWEGVITYTMGDPEFVKKGYIVFGIKEKE